MWFLLVLVLMGDAIEVRAYPMPTERACEAAASAIADELRDAAATCERWA